jgi:hypothetical protein
MQALVQVSVSPKAGISIKVNSSSDSISYQQKECCIIFQLGDDICTIQLVKASGLFVGVEKAKLAAILNNRFRHLAAFSDLSPESSTPSSPFLVIPLHLSYGGGE